MPTTKYTAGKATITLTGDLEAWTRRVLASSAGAVVREVEKLAEEVASEARREWYDRVERKTGLSGDIAVETTIDLAQGVARVAVGSTDERIADGKPLVVYVHEPGPTSLIDVAVSHREYWDTPAALRRQYPIVKKQNPKTAAGKFLLQELIRTPAKAKIQGRIPQIQAAMGRAARGE